LNRRNYQKELEVIIKQNEDRSRVPRLFLHSCCAPCSSYVLEYLSKYFEITVFYYNPNISPKEEYEKLIQWNYERGGGYPIHPLVRVCLTANKVFFGPGTAQLLENIEKTGSIQEACVQMEMSYSKGSRLIKKAERQLGFPVTERRAGGLGGGGTMLTREGKRLLKQYKSLVEEVQKSANNLYQDYFGKGIRA